MPSSVDCVTETTPGWTACSSPIRTIQRSTSSGVSLPSGVGTVSSLIPASVSGAPPSSTFRCALSAQIDALPRAQHRAQADDVRAGAVEDREGGGVVAEVALDHGLEARGGLVGAVGDGVAVVDGGDGVQRLGQDGGVVVAREGSHGARR